MTHPSHTAFPVETACWGGGGESFLKHLIVTMTTPIKKDMICFDMVT